MKNFVQVPRSIWQEVSDFFSRIVAPCKDCARGNSIQCWESRCGAFRFRPISRRVLSVNSGLLNLVSWVVVDQEILSVLKLTGRPMRPSEFRLESTRSRANKHSAVKRLVSSGRVVQTFVNGHRYISLPNHQRRKENEPTKPTDRRGATRRASARKLGAGLADAGLRPGAV